MEAMLPLPKHNICPITTFDSGEETDNFFISEDNRKALTCLFDLFLETICRMSAINPSLQNTIYEKLKERMKSLKIKKFLGNIFTNTTREHHELFKQNFISTIQKNIIELRSEIEHAPPSNALNKLELKMDYAGVIQTGRYGMEFIEQGDLGQGGFAIVKKVFRKLEAKSYAIKIIDMSIYSGRFFTTSGFDEAIREVRALAHLVHPNIVLYHTAWIEITFPGKIIAQKKRVEIQSYYSVSEKEDAVDESVKDDCEDSSQSEQSESDTKMTESDSSSTSEYSNYQKMDLDDSSKTDSIIFQSTSQQSSETIETDSVSLSTRIVKKKSSTTKYAMNHQVERLTAIPTFLNQSATCFFYIQMELCGETLDKYIQRNHKAHPKGGPLNIDTICLLFHQMLDAVAYFHSKDIIHRDLKPKNIFFDSQNPNVVKIGDFGLACIGYAIKDIDRTTLELSQGLGTYPYSAPEQRNGKIYDSKVDIYSLGIILLEMFYPFQTRSELLRVISSDIEVFVNQEIKPSYPDFASVIIKMTSEDPANRPSAKQLLNSIIFQKFMKCLTREEDRAAKLLLIESKEENVDKLKEQIVSLNNRVKELEEMILKNGLG